MKRSFLSITVAVLLGALSCPGQCKVNPKKAALPPSVRAEMPVAIVSVALFQLAPAPGAKPFLFHLWSAPRLGSDSGNVVLKPGSAPKILTAVQVKVGGLRSSPFVLDVFAPGAKVGQWKYQTSIRSFETEPPKNYALRYLDAKQKTGFVVTTSEFLDMREERLAYAVHVFPDGWSNGEEAKSNEFRERNSPLGSKRYSFARDEQGRLQIIEVERDTETQPPSESKTVLGWRFGTWKEISSAAKPGL